MDVEIQVESKGLLNEFAKTSEQPGQTDIASSLVAAISNTGAPPLIASDASQTATSESAAPNGILHNGNPPATNGILQASVAVPVESVSKPLSDQPTLEPSPASFNDSGIASSLPTQAKPDVMETELTETTITSVADPAPALEAPISDLRTAPHADDLTSAQVAQVEAEKHNEDNAIGTPLSEPADAPTTLITEPVKLSNTGLSTPPTQSPPLAPQSEHATLPHVAIADPEPTVSSQEKPAKPVAPAAFENQEMTDAPSQPKQSREREDDQDVTEPATKRVKTDDNSQSHESMTGDNSQSHEFKVPELPVASSPQTIGSPAPLSDLRLDGDDSITHPRLAQMKKIISNLKKSNASAAFRLPVDHVALNIPTYPEIIKHPMDLGTIDHKLKQNQYIRLTDFITDFELIVANCITFNGKDHAVTQAAYKMQSSFNNQMKNNMPQAAVVELSREEKKAAKAKQEPTRQAPPRRPSVSTSQVAAGSARSPAAVPSTPFAPGPDGVPLIRRDSTMADGRPKRAIVPPKRNHEFAGGRPKKKKYELQLRFCQEVLKDIASPKHWQINQFFTHPVDPVALNIPTYFQVIKKPMDFETIQTKLNNNVYEKAKDFEEDVRLVFKNCYKFNPESDWVNQAGHQLEQMFDKKWATKDEWIAAREPQSDPQSEEEDDDDAESEDDDDSEAERNEKIAALQKQIAEMSKQMGELTNKKSKKKSKSPSTAPKKSKSKSSKKEKPKTTFPGLQKSAEKKKSSSKPAKERYVTFQEKQYISNGIAMLPEKQMQEALKIIQQSVPSLANSAENEIELDIEEVPNHALIKLLAFVKRFAGPPPDEPKADSDGYSASAVSKNKKNRPNKQEQEAQIEALRGQLGAYNGDAVSPGAMQSIEPGDSSDDGDSEESEEE
ncbi:hypothetical protein DV736_g1119, partial [Chaetothyriales sp. CBS 134916]